jgi:tetratricopeptide (TPR) repeat protein
VHSHPDGHGNAQLARFYADHDRNLDKAVLEAELTYRTYKNVFVADTLAWCYYKKGEYEKARNTMLKALQHNTPDASLWFHAGMISAKTSDKGTARKYLYHALSLNPHFHPQQAMVAAETLKLLAERPAGNAGEADEPGE